MARAAQPIPIQGEGTRRRRLGTNKNISILYYWWGSKIPSAAPPRGPESIPRAQKRSPRAIPNDSRVGQQSANNDKRVETSGTYTIENVGLLGTCGTPGARAREEAQDATGLTLGDLRSIFYRFMFLSPTPTSTTRPRTGLWLRIYKVWGHGCHQTR